MSRKRSGAGQKTAATQYGGSTKTTGSISKGGAAPPPPRSKKARHLREEPWPGPRARPKPR